MVASWTAAGDSVAPVWPSLATVARADADVGDGDASGAGESQRRQKSGRDSNGSGAATDEETAGDKLAGFARLLRIGQTSRGILIPAVERGSMTSMTTAESLTRRSEDYLDLVELAIQFYGSDGEPDARLSAPQAEFHLPTGILLSDHRTLVSRSDFDLEGDRFAFDTNTRRGRFEGNVTMVIHSLDQFRESGAEPTPDLEADLEPEAGSGADAGDNEPAAGGARQTDPAPEADTGLAPDDGAATAEQDS